MNGLLGNRGRARGDITVSSPETPKEFVPAEPCEHWNLSGERGDSDCGLLEVRALCFCSGQGKTHLMTGRSHGPLLSVSDLKGESSLEARVSSEEGVRVWIYCGAVEASPAWWAAEHLPLLSLFFSYCESCQAPSLGAKRQRKYCIHRPKLRV